ncbi:hypothetical protein [Komagataeibacter diospyri]|uniref:hypothetical protein n=1 Tax=Komagataeibacter diospyri TaxID=1932662 RepID=UPI003757814F
MRKRFRVSIPELLRSALLGALCALAGCYLTGPHGGAVVSLLIMFGLMAAWAFLSILILIDRWEG